MHEIITTLNHLYSISQAKQAVITTVRTFPLFLLLTVAPAYFHWNIQILQTLNTCGLVNSHSPHFHLNSIEGFNILIFGAGKERGSTDYTEWFDTSDTLATLCLVMQWPGRAVSRSLEGGGARWNMTITSGRSVNKIITHPELVLGTDWRECSAETSQSHTASFSYKFWSLCYRLRKWGKGIKKTGPSSGRVEGTDVLRADTQQVYGSAERDVPRRPQSCPGRSWESRVPSHSHSSAPFPYPHWSDPQGQPMHGCMWTGQRSS